MNSRLPLLALLPLLIACANLKHGNLKDGNLKDGGDPLPSWNDGPSKTAIMEFVARVTNERSADYILPAERIATFDNDGTLWSEKPLYFQLVFAIDRVKEMAPEHPEWKTIQPFKAAIEDDREALLKS